MRDGLVDLSLVTSHEVGRDQDLIADVELTAVRRMWIEWTITLDACSYGGGMVKLFRDVCGRFKRQGWARLLDAC